MLMLQGVTPPGSVKQGWGGKKQAIFQRNANISKTVIDRPTSVVTINE